MALLFGMCIFFALLGALALWCGNWPALCALALWGLCYAALPMAPSPLFALLLLAIPPSALFCWRMAARMRASGVTARPTRSVVSIVVLIALVLASGFTFLKRYGMETADNAARAGNTKSARMLMSLGILPSTGGAYALYGKTPPADRPELLRLLFSTRHLWWTDPARDASGNPLSPIDPAAMITGMVQEQRTVGDAAAMKKDPEYKIMAEYLARSPLPEDKLAVWRYLSGGNAFYPEESAVFSGMLLAAGADPNSTGPEDAFSSRRVSALARAAGRGAAVHVAQLLAAGADPAQTDGLGNTALHYAAYSGTAECAALLIRAGAPLNAQGESNRTALMQTLVWRKDKEMLPLAEALLHAGADPRITDAEGTSAMTLVAKKTAGFDELGKEEVARLLKALDAAIQMQGPLRTSTPARPATGGSK